MCELKIVFFLCLFFQYLLKKISVCTICKIILADSKHNLKTGTFVFSFTNLKLSFTLKSHELFIPYSWSSGHVVTIFPNTEKKIFVHIYHYIFSKLFWWLLYTTINYAAGLRGYEWRGPRQSSGWSCTCHLIMTVQFKINGPDCLIMTLLRCKWITSIGGTLNFHN